MKIDESQSGNFSKEGYMIIPDFLDQKELSLLRKICDVKISDIEAEMTKNQIKEDRINVYGKKYFIPNVWKKHASLEAMVFTKKFADVCKMTIGDTAFIHNEQFVVKMRDKDTSFAWHQDSGYSIQGGASPHKPYLTCWIALDDMSYSNGTISVLPFSRSPSRDLMTHVWDDKLNAMVGYNGKDPGDLVEVPAGTLVAFSSFLLHKSGSNQTDNPRRSYFIAFTPELFPHSDKSKGIYSSGEPFIGSGEIVR